MEARHYYVYILASRTGGTLYIGVTNDLVRRVFEHKSKLIELVYFEQFDDPENAIKREKRLKKWNRDWKIRLIEKHNPNWEDLYPGIAARTPCHALRRRGIQYAAALMIRLKRHRVLDRPPSRTMTLR